MELTTKTRANSNSENQNGSDEDKGSDNKSRDRKKVKKYRVDPTKDGFPTIFADEEFREKIFFHLPLIKVKKLKKNPKILNAITGPFDITFPTEIFEPLICGRSISTYPHIPGKPTRDGDPICDSYSVQLLEDDDVIALVCDGCNWGRRPMEASNVAKSCFIDFVKRNQNDIEELRDAGHVLLQALSYCHFKICEGKEDVWEAGTTTLLGGMLLRVRKTKEELKEEKKIENNVNTSKEDRSFKWVWVCVSIGDCKAFHYSAASRTVKDLTLGNRKNVYDPKDCGGRLGPYVGNGGPDLGNVMVYHAFCEEDDELLILSDGVHDNLDPQVLGKSPKDCGPQWTEFKDWSSFKSDEECNSAKAQYMRDFLATELILGGESDDKLRSKVFANTMTNSSSSNSNGNSTFDPALSPANITSRIMKHCLAVTSKGREWMEQNPKEKLPNDYVEYPGKNGSRYCSCDSSFKISQELYSPNEFSNCGFSKKSR